MKRVAAIKNVVTEDQRDVVFADERFGDKKRLGNASRLQLFAVFDGEPPLLAIPQQLDEARQVLRRGNHAQFTDAALDERRQRIINHGFVIDRLQLFARDARERKQPGPGASGKNNAFH